MGEPIRQGDVLLTQVTDRKVISDVRKNATIIRRTRGLGLVLAEGEVTGHHHRVTTHGIKLLERGRDRFLDVPKGKTAELQHDEHETLKIGPGLHKISGQREYVPQAAPVRVYD